ncbi:MAG TPA: hypothetical protein VGS12_12010 [Caulobacteraceae bacterium]|nr:hypothetical protein [Caulobacteraceae bacterium]
MSYRQSPNARAPRHAFDRTLSIFDKTALGLLYVFVIAGLPLAALGVVTGVA